MTGAFEHLNGEKKQRIINAAMETFSTYGYKKASVADIARNAQISKAMIFTYFHSKKECYRFMCEEMLRIATQEFNRFRDNLLALTDFFDRIILSVKIKVSIFKSFPSLLSFATSIITEKDDDVKPIINEIMSKGYALREMFLNSGIDSSKFKNPDDVKAADLMARWLSAGCADEWARGGNDKLDQIVNSFIDCIIKLKNNFYKEECLK